MPNKPISDGSTIRTSACFDASQSWFLQAPHCWTWAVAAEISCDFSGIRPDLRLTGIDLAANAGVAGVRFLQGDVLAAELDEHFDVVTALAVIQHVPDLTKFLHQLRRFAKPGGMIALMTVNNASLLYVTARAARRWGIPVAFNRVYSCHHVHHFTRKSLEFLLARNGLSIEKHFDHDAPIEAMDIPVAGKLADTVLRSGLRVLWFAGRLTRRSYLQTVICRNSQPA